MWVKPTKALMLRCLQISGGVVKFSNPVAASEIKKEDLTDAIKLYSEDLESIQSSFNVEVEYGSHFLRDANLSIFLLLLFHKKHTRMSSSP